MLLVAYCCEVPKKLQVEEGISKALRAVPNQDENPLISRNKGFTSGFWGLISEDKERLVPHPPLSSEIRGCTQVYLCVPRCTFIVPLQKYQAFLPQSIVKKYHNP